MPECYHEYRADETNRYYCIICGQQMREHEHTIENGRCTICMLKEHKILEDSSIIRRSGSS